MAKAVKTRGTSGKSRAALTPESREDQLVALAVNLIEQRLRDGTASSQETTTLLKMSSRKSRLELEVLKQQIELSKAKTESLKSAQRIEELYNNAMKALRSYQGKESEDDSDGE